jgi:hypothetical protein
LAKKKGEQYKGEGCGLVVIVEDPCGCEDACGLICCEAPMKQVKSSVKSAAFKVTKKPKK